jgi:hypothetical protein
MPATPVPLRLPLSPRCQFGRKPCVPHRHARSETRRVASSPSPEGDHFLRTRSMRLCVFPSRPAPVPPHCHAWQRIRGRNGVDCRGGGGERGKASGNFRLSRWHSSREDGSLSPSVILGLVPRICQVSTRLAVADARDRPAHDGARNWHDPSFPAEFRQVRKNWHGLQE